MRFLFLFSVLFLLSCNTASHCHIGDIEIAASVMEQAKKYAFPYCQTFYRAAKRDEIALLQLVRFAYKTDDNSAVEHGIAFTELSIKLGDDFMSNFLKRQRTEHQLLAAKMFQACMEYREPSLDIEHSLPLTLHLLNDLLSK
jgi:hypothetical protein